MGGKRGAQANQLEADCGHLGGLMKGYPDHTLRTTALSFNFCKIFLSSSWGILATHLLNFSFPSKYIVLSARCIVLSWGDSCILKAQISTVGMIQKLVYSFRSTLDVLLFRDRCTNLSCH